jgi:hypothetical protein
MERISTDKRIWTVVSEDGKHAAAGMSLGAVGMKPGGGARSSPTTDMDDTSGPQVGKASRAVAKYAARWRSRGSHPRMSSGSMPKNSRA